MDAVISIGVGYATLHSLLLYHRTIIGGETYSRRHSNNLPTGDRSTRAIRNLRSRPRRVILPVHDEAAALGAVEVLEIATLGDVSVLGRTDIGALAPGIAADFIGYRLERLDFAGALHDPLAALVFCAPPKVDLSVIDARVHVKDGETVSLNLPALVRRQTRSAGRCCGEN